MAFCPKCQGEIAANEVKCPKCGYDFPAPAEPDERRGWTFSYGGEFFLIVAQFAATVAIVLGLIEVLVRIAHREYWEGLVVLPIQILILMGAFVALDRVRKM